METKNLKETVEAEAELFRSCRVGDLEKVRYLVECSTVELNLRDAWDSTPLYYACLCGHEEVVEYLLINGAKCEANTFDGERCLYAAINDHIRKLLRTYKAITPECMRRDSYREWLRRCLLDSTFADICFVVQGCPLFAHRVILAARSEYFNNMFQTKWKGKLTVRLNNPLVKPWAFKAVLQYLYTDRVDIDVDKFDDCIILARQCKLHHLRNRLEVRLREMETFVIQKPGTNIIKALTIEPQSGATTLYGAFSTITKQVTTPVYQISSTEPESPEDFLRSLLLALPDEHEVCSKDVHPPYADVCFEIQDCRFYGHKVFFCGRSDYFKVLLSGYFAECVSHESYLEHQEEIPIFRLNHISPEVFSSIVSYIYQNTAELSEENVYNVLYMADHYLITGLKQLCANKIKHLLHADNVITVLKASRLFGLERLEIDCCQFITTVLEKIVEKDEFTELVLEDAAGITAREETDSIPVIDDIRFHLYNTALPSAGLEELDSVAKLNILNDFLLKLGLEC